MTSGHDHTPEPACPPNGEPSHRLSYRFRGRTMGELLRPRKGRMVHVSWRRRDQALMSYFLADRRLDLETIEDEPLRDLAVVMGILVDQLTDLEWDAIAKKIRSSFRYTLGAAVKAGRIPVRFDDQQSRNVLDWPEDVRQEWLSELPEADAEALSPQTTARSSSSSSTPSTAALLAEPSPKGNSRTGTDADDGHQQGTLPPPPPPSPPPSPRPPSPLPPLRSRFISAQQPLFRSGMVKHWLERQTLLAPGGAPPNGTATAPPPPTNPCHAQLINPVVALSRHVHGWALSSIAVTGAAVGLMQVARESSSSSTRLRCHQAARRALGGSFAAVGEWGSVSVSPWDNEAFCSGDACNDLLVELLRHDHERERMMAGVWSASAAVFDATTTEAAHPAGNARRELIRWWAHPLLAPSLYMPDPSEPWLGSKTADGRFRASNGPRGGG